MIKKKEQDQSTTSRAKSKNNNKEKGSRIKNKKQRQQNRMIKNIHKINDENGKQTRKLRANITYRTKTKHNEQALEKHNEETRMNHKDVRAIKSI